MKYRIFYHKVRGNGEYDGFISAGIVVKNDSGNEVKRIFDVSTDFTALEKLVLSLNINDVSFEHLDSVLEDYYLNHC